MFQHTAAQRRLPFTELAGGYHLPFQHTAAQRRLRLIANSLPMIIAFQHTAAQRRLLVFLSFHQHLLKVSTHSRAEAAANIIFIHFTICKCFNTQPRRGGCKRPSPSFSVIRGFNTQPRRGGCNSPTLVATFDCVVSTHSRAEAAAFSILKTV